MDLLSQRMYLTGTALAVVLAFCITRVLGNRLLGKKKKYHPITGTLFHLLFNFNRLHHYLTDLACKHRSFRFLGRSESIVYTAEPANVEYILKTNFENYGKGRNHHSILADLLGDGIFTVDGEKWRHQRKVSSDEFSTKILRDFSSVVFRSNAAKLAQKLSEAATSNQIIEIQGLLMKSTLDSVFMVILGIELDCLYGTNEEDTQFCKAFDEASAITLYRYVDFFWKIKRFLNIGSEAVLRDNIKVINKFVHKIINSKLEQVQNSQNCSPMKKGDILSRLLESKETAPKQLKDMILSYITAGKDTTATTLSWFFYMICKYPLIQEKLAHEVRVAAQVNGNFSFEELAASITDDALHKMQYLHAALTETLRLYPAVPVDGKLCFSDDTWPDGFSVRRGDEVSYMPYAMGRMKFLWGDDAEEFRPERWLDENGIFQQESSFKFTAFQAGPRICLGKEFAYRQMKILSAVLLSAYVFKLSDENKVVHYKTMLSLHIDGGLHLHASRRMAYGAWKSGGC